MSNYARGRKLEYEVAEIFRSAGYDVIRGSSSKGTFAGIKADLIATKVNGDTRSIAIVVMQAKRRKA